jgi:hypothetical protein
VLIVSPTLEARFWTKVVVPIRDDGSMLPDTRQCWLWAGAKCGGRPGGGEPYGTIKAGKTVDGRAIQKKAHVVAFFLHNEKWPTLDVCHKCDNPLCCNPHHLFEASHQVNMLDYLKKFGRLGIPKSQWPAPPRPRLPGLDDDDEDDSATAAGLPPDVHER